MMYIGERLALIPGDMTKMALLKSAHSQWGHQPRFRWVGWDDVIDTNSITKTLSSEGFNLFGPQPITSVEKTATNHLRQTSCDGSPSHVLDLRSNCGRVLETDNSYQGSSMDPFDMSKVVDYYDSATNVLALTDITYRKTFPPGIAHQAFNSADEESTVLQPEVANKQVESSCNLCGVPHSVESLSSDDGFCEACSAICKLDSGWEQLEHLKNIDGTLAQVFDNNLANESRDDLLDIEAISADSGDSAIEPMASDGWLGGGSCGCGSRAGLRRFKKLPVGKIGGGGKTVGLDLSSYPNLSTEDLLTPGIGSDPWLESDNTAVPRRTSRTSGSAYGAKKKGRTSRIPGNVYGAEEPDDFLNFLDYDSPRPLNLSFRTHSIVRSNSPPDDSNLQKLLV